MNVLTGEATAVETVGGEVKIEIDAKKTNFCRPKLLTPFQDIKLSMAHRVAGLRGRGFLATGWTFPQPSPTRTWRERSIVKKTKQDKLALVGRRRRQHGFSADPWPRVDGSVGLSHPLRRHRKQEAGING